MHTQQEIDAMAKALRARGLTWSQTNFAVSLVRNAEADRDMLRDALAGLEAAVGSGDIDLGTPIWHALEDAQQALAQAGGPNVGAKAPT